MKGPTRRLRLSPNEEARIIKEEKERRRKLRLVQVREQAKVNASNTRKAVKQEREIQISILAAEIKDEWEEEKAEKVRKLQEIHLRSLRHVGDAHVNASEQEPTDVERALIEQENLQRAAQRHLDAIKKMKEDKKKKDDEAKRHIVARQWALEQEKERAAEVAALPPRDPDPVKDIAIPKVKPIKLTDVNAFSSTHFHMPMEEYAVERALPAEIADAHQAAVEEQDRVETMEEEERVAAHERQEKARLRHKHARQKVLLKQDYDHMLLDLSDLRRSDIVRRQQVVAKIPRAVYQAPHRRMEEKEEEQREMEAAFEDMYMAATENQGDLTLALERHPAPAVTPAGSSAFDLSLDPGDLDKVPHGQRAPFGAPLKDLTNMQRMAQGKSNGSALGKLMGRIQAQRETWVKQPEPVDSPPQRQPMVPLERDLSSTTTGGSLTQYTISSVGTATTLEESSTDASSVTTHTGSRSSSVPMSQRSVSSVTVTDSDVTTTTEGTLEEGTISSSTSAYSTTMQTDTTGNGTLLHPMEIAAKVRQKTLTDSSAPMASFLDQRKFTNQPNLEQLVQDFREEQQRLEKERKKLEKKMKELEGQSLMLTPLELAQKYLRELPPVPPEQIQPLPAAATPEISIRESETPMSSSLSQADKVRLYQQRALERRRGRDSSLLGTSMDRSSTLASTPSPQRSPVGLHSNVSVMTSPSGALSSISGIPTDTSNSQHQLGGSPYSGKSGATTDLSQQSYHSHDFDSRQVALKAQLAEIEQQRAEIQAQQERYHDDMHQTKERWQRELEQYSQRDSQAAAERSLSLLTVEAQNQSSANQVEVGKEDYTEWVDSDDAIDEDLSRQLNNLPHKATDHKYKIQRRKPASKAIKVPNKSPVIPHDLSTIQELDTPMTDKKYSTQAMNSTELEGRKDKTSVSRSLFENQMQTVPEADASDALDYNSRYAPPNDLYFLAGLGQFEPPPLEQPRAPQQLSQHFTKVPSEVDTLSAGRSEDFADMYGDRYHAGLESKTIIRPMPSIDRVEEIHRLPDTPPGERFITPAAPPPPPVQDYTEYQGDQTAFSTLSTGPLVEDSEYHPDSTGITINDNQSAWRTTQVQDDQQNDPISTHRYSRSQSHEETPPRAEPQPLPRTPSKPYSPTSSSPKFEFTSHYVALKDQSKDKNWKKELSQYNMSYLTPPKMSPARPTDKIVRCITTRAFGCERPVKGTAKTKAEMEEKHRANLMPARDVPTVGIHRVISPEEDMSPARIREMFEQTSGRTNPMGSPIPKDKPSRGFIDQSGQFLSSTPSSDKILSRLRTGEGAASEQGATPTEPIDRRSMEGSQNRSGSGKYDRVPGTLSFTGNETVTPSDRSGRSSLSQYRLDSDADMTKTSANVSHKTDASLDQYPLSASAGRSETMTSMSLSQYTLEDSRRVSAPGGSPPGSASFARSTQGQGFSNFHPLMEMSRASDGSARSGLKSPLQSNQVYGMQDSTSLSQTGWTQPHGQFTEPRTMGAFSDQQKTDSVHEASTEPSQNCIDLAMDISKKAEAAMEKYDRLMDESRRLRQQYDVEERTLMAEARSSSRHSSQQSEAAIEQNLSRSLERLAQEETGISEEPDITLVSVSSTPQKVSPWMPDEDPEPVTAMLEDRLVESQAESKGSDQPRSLLSFEQHEQSLATMSQQSLIRPSLSDEKNSMTSSLTRSGADTEVLTPYASSSSTGVSSLAASGPGGGTGASSSAAKGAQRPKEERSSMAQENQKHISRTLASWKKNNALSAPTANPPDSSSAATSISMTTKTSADQKKKEHEMKQRTEKLYNQLEDVKQQRQDKQRQEDYATNRQRKLEYQKNIQEQLKKKYQDKKK